MIYAKKNGSGRRFNLGLFFYIIVIAYLVATISIGYMGEILRLSNSNAKFDIGKYAFSPHIKITSIGITFPFNFFKKAKLTTQDGVTRNISLLRYEADNDSYKLFFEYNIVLTFFMLDKSLSVDVSIPDNIIKEFKEISLPWQLQQGFSSDSDGNEMHVIYSDDESYYVFYNAQETVFDEGKQLVRFTSRGKNLLVIGEQDIGEYKSFRSFWDTKDNYTTLEEQDAYFTQMFKTISTQLERLLESGKIFLPSLDEQNDVTIEEDRLLAKMSMAHKLGLFDIEIESIKRIMDKKRVNFTPTFSNYTGSMFQSRNKDASQEKLTYIQEQVDQRNPEIFRDLTLASFILENDTIDLRLELVRLAVATRFSADEDLDVTVGRMHFISQLLLSTSNRAQRSVELDAINYLIDILKESLISLNDNLYLYDGDTLHLYASAIMAANLYALGESDLVKNRILWVRDKNEFHIIAMYMFKAILSRTSGSGQIAKTAQWEVGTSPVYSKDIFYLYEILKVLTRSFYKPAEFDQTHMLGSSLKINTLSSNVFSMYEYDNRKKFKVVLDLPRGISYSYFYNIPTVNEVIGKAGFIKQSKDAMDSEESWDYDVSRQLLTVKHNIKKRSTSRNIAEYTISMENPLEGSLDFMNQLMAEEALKAPEEEKPVVKKSSRKKKKKS